jgi:uncharacterized protein YaeQ
MAIKATIHKAEIHLADLDRQVYADHAVTLARHPSETDERLLVRLLAFTLHAPASDPDSDPNAPLVFAKDIWNPDEPSLWRKDPTGRVLHWIDVGLPDEKRFTRVSPRVDLMTVIAYGQATAVWWKELQPRLTRLRNVHVHAIPPAQSQAIATLAQRSMRLQVTVQDGSIWIDDGTRSAEVTLQRLAGPP